MENNEILDDGLWRERTHSEESERLLLKMEAETALHHIRNGRYALFALAAVVVVAGFILSTPSGGSIMGAEDGDVIFYGALILAVTYFSLGLLSLKYYVAAFGLGLGIYGLSVLADLVQDPVNIVRGILIKILVIYYLAKGLMSAIKLGKVFDNASELGFSREALME